MRINKKQIYVKRSLKIPKIVKRYQLFTVIIQLKILDSSDPTKINQGVTYLFSQLTDLQIYGQEKKILSKIHVAH